MDDAVEAVAIATPPVTPSPGPRLPAGGQARHDREADRCVGARGPEQIIRAAAAVDRVVMCDHTYCYTPAVRYLADALAQGALGRIHYLDSVRINLGLVQPDVSVLWDLAPHDLSILDFILPGGLDVRTVAAHGADPLGAGQACVAYLTLGLACGAIAHVHVNWLSPIKVRTMMIGGSDKTLVWDDLNPTQRVSVYDRGVDFHADASAELRHRSQISYRIGDVLAPALGEREALGAALEEFADAIREHRAPATDGGSGLRVLRLLEAASASLGRGGATIAIDPTLENVA
ncbi:MAG: gfo/Idh/MocA family oxidoreductase [Acidimicrobiales bacterium]